MPTKTLSLLMVLLLATLLGVHPPRASAASTLTNGTFGISATQTPAGWNSSGSTQADYTEAGGRSGLRLTHWSAQAYNVSTPLHCAGEGNGLGGVRSASPATTGHRPK